MGNTTAGDGVVATGGFTFSGFAGAGVSAKGGDSTTGNAGIGIIATGGVQNNGTTTKGETGVRANGADADSGGAGIQAFGGSASGAGHTGGDGVVGVGGFPLAGATEGRAGVFFGNVEIIGSLNVSGTKNFKIDHPLDPENKYLYHAAIESSEVLNVYSGNVITNENGEATVRFPDWFESINRDFRYQLTVVGTFAQAIVADEIQNNRFTIRSNAPGVKVSWQVTGVRSDALMRKQPFKVEEDKPERERGTYLSPQAFDQPEEKGVEREHNPERMQSVKEAREKALKAKQN